MDRRGLLKALGSAGIAGFAGCTTRAVGSGGSQTTGLKRRISLVKQDTVPSKYNLNLDATVVNATSNKQHPATVKITATNTGSKRQIDIGTGRCGLFNRSDGGSSPKGLWLHLTGKDAPKHRKNKWESTRPASQQRGYPQYGCGYGAFPAGASRTTTYGVWSDYQVQAYLKPGTYRFQRDRILIQDTGSTTTTTDSPSYIQWGFTIKLSTLN